MLVDILENMCDVNETYFQVATEKGTSHPAAPLSTVPWSALQQLTFLVIAVNVTPD